MPSPDGGLFGAPIIYVGGMSLSVGGIGGKKGRGTAVMPLPMAMPIGILLIRGPRNFSTEKLDLGEPKRRPAALGSCRS